MSLPSKGKILALDLGTRCTGVAICDKEQKVVFLRQEIEHSSDKDLLEQMAQLLSSEEGIIGILAGLPLKLNGEKSPQTQKVEAQVELLKEKFKLPVEFIDERFSSQEAFEPKMKKVDSRSAQILLENYVSHH